MASASASGNGSTVVVVDGLRLRVSVREGSEGGPPLLLVMGIGGNLDMWEPLRAALPGLGTIAFDAPGAGGSSTPRRPLTMGGIARVVEHALDALGCDAVDVLGVSWGGALAQQLAHQARRRVRRLVLVSTMCGLGGVLGRPSAMAVLASPARYYSPAYLERVAPTLYGGRIRREPGLYRQQAEARLSRPPSVLGYSYQLWAIAQWSSLPFLSRLRQPTLVLAGDDDPVVPVANARILAARIPHARLHVERGGGHLLLLDSTDAVAPPIAAFLRE